MTIDEVLAFDRSPAGHRKRPAVALTFDDDLPSHAEYALPVLREVGVPAAFFLTDGHLHRRVRSLLTGRRRSIGGLAVSYSLIGFLLLVFTAGVVIWFPLIGEARIRSVLKQEQLLPRILIARGQAFPSEKGPVQNFELRVAEPAVRSGNVMYRMDDADAGAVAEVQTMPLPEILHAPPMLFEYGRSTSQGIRMVRPGQIATPEELAGLQELFGEGAQIEVRQATDGTIQRLTILRRRSSDESSTDFPGIGIGPAGVVSAGAAIRSDVEH